MVFLDFETRSVCDLKKYGTWAYVNHPTTQVICMAWAVGDGPVSVVWLGQKPPQEFLDAVAGGEVAAHNAAFDIPMLERFCGVVVPPERIIDTAAICRMNNVPAALADAADFLGLEFKKATKGKLLIAKLSRPKTMEPLTWNERPEVLAGMYEYNKQDVEVCRAIYRALPGLPKGEREVWCMDWKINSRGIGCDMDFVERGLRLRERETSRLDTLIREATGGEVSAHTEVAKMTEWVRARGVEIETLDKRAIEALDLSTLPEDVQVVVGARKEAAKSSLAKLDKLKATAVGGRARGTLVYHGAGTGRWAGRGGQPQNLPRLREGYEKTLEAFLEDTTLVCGCGGRAVGGPDIGS